jgi:vacuolar-type H+-ATPase subunit H
MDILHLVDRLEELFNDSGSLPLTKKVILDEEKLLDLIDQMRLAIPDEIKKAQSIVYQKERIIAQSHEEANRTVSLAREQSEKLVSKDVIVQEAKIIADDIIKRARDETELIKKEADQYAVDSLDYLEIELSKILTQVRNGMISLKDTQTMNDNTPEQDTDDSPITPVTQS